MRSGAQMLASWRWLRVHAAFHPERLDWFRLHYCQVSQVVKEVASDCAYRCFRPMASLPANVPLAPRCAPQLLSLVLCERCTDVLVNIKISVAVVQVARSRC